MDTLQNLLLGFSVALQPYNLFFCLVGSLIGTLVGVLPGLGPAASMAILIPFAAGLDPTAAIIMLAAIYYGAMYGGSTTSILLNIPGEAASVVTCLDGYQMARQGRAGAALSISAISSFIAGTVGLIGLVFLAPLLVDVALKFGPPEHFGLLVLGLSVAVSLAGKSLAKGLASVAFGLLLAAVGIDPQSGLSRYTFGVISLMGGFDVVVVVVGLFAIAEVLSNAETPAFEIFKGKIAGLWPSMKDLRDSLAPIARGSFVGFLLGLIPGIVPPVITFVSYDLEKRCSKHPELFGTGRIEGVAAPEGANNACTSSGMIPLFTLGLPTTASLAVLLGALMIHGLQPGPMLFEQQKEFVWAVIASMYIGNVMLLVLNLPLIPLWVSLLKIPYPLLGPAILVICVIAAYGVRNSLFDVWIMLAFGFLGYIMRKLEFPAIPLIIALILGDRLENALRQSLSMSRGSLAVFVTRPIAVGFLLLATASIGYSLYYRYRKRKE
ncbi:MAG: tripartite tricarboxylate transporter permease [candidate division NC10 bacterium]